MSVSARDMRWQVIRTLVHCCSICGVTCTFCELQDMRSTSSGASAIGLLYWTAKAVTQQARKSDCKVPGKQDRFRSFSGKDKYVRLKFVADCVGNPKVVRLLSLERPACVSCVGQFE